MHTGVSAVGWIGWIGSQTGLQSHLLWMDEAPVSQSQFQLTIVPVYYRLPAIGQGTDQHNSYSKKKWALIISGALVLLTCLFNGYNFGPQERSTTGLAGSTLVSRHYSSSSWECLTVFSLTFMPTSPVMQLWFV